MKIDWSDPFVLKTGNCLWTAASWSALELIVIGFNSVFSSANRDGCGCDLFSVDFKYLLFSCCHWDVFIYYLLESTANTTYLVKTSFIIGYYFSPIAAVPQIKSVQVQFLWGVSIQEDWRYAWMFCHSVIKFTLTNRSDIVVYLFIKYSRT